MRLGERGRAPFSPRRSASHGVRVRHAIVAIVIVAMIAIPAIALVQEKPARFGFQMYSGYGEGAITVLDSEGDEIDLDLAALLPRPLRPELDWTRYVPEHLCSEIPEAATIVIDQDLTGTSTLPCD